MIAKSFRVTGVVQGVGFRAFTERTARALELGGWVRNTPDGSVEGHVEGEEIIVTRFVEALRSGPPASRVSRLELTETTPLGHRSFAVRR